MPNYQAGPAQFSVYNPIGAAASDVKDASIDEVQEMAQDSDAYLLLSDVQARPQIHARRRHGVPSSHGLGAHTGQRRRLRQTGGRLPRGYVWQSQDYPARYGQGMVQLCFEDGEQGCPGLAEIYPAQVSANGREAFIFENKWRLLLYEFRLPCDCTKLLADV